MLRRKVEAVFGSPEFQAELERKMPRCSPRGRLSNQSRPAPPPRLQRLPPIFFRICRVRTSPISPSREAPMMPLAGQVNPRETSLGLWRTWFDAGLEAIDQRNYTAAAEWLGEALEHIQPAGVHERLHAITQANLAYSLWRLGQEYEERANAECTPPPLRSEFLAHMEERLQAAYPAANAALPKLKFDEQYPPVNLAIARARRSWGRDFSG